MFAELQETDPLLPPRRGVPPEQGPAPCPAPGDRAGVIHLRRAGCIARSVLLTPEKKRVLCSLNRSTEAKSSPGT